MSDMSIRSSEYALPDQCLTRSCFARSRFPVTRAIWRRRVGAGARPVFGPMSIAPDIWSDLISNWIHIDVYVGYSRFVGGLLELYA